MGLGSQEAMSQAKRKQHIRHESVTISYLFIPFPLLCGSSSITILFCFGNGQVCYDLFPCCMMLTRLPQYVWGSFTLIAHSLQS